ncbi:MAG: choice-of-anchor J domain-containing protein, partial [Bacteroidales bacterium]|nr:choice-of-anchor J domain-containing protein [Bacteroidales bacterium]
MKRLLFFLMAIIFAITGKAQTPLAENFSSSTFPPTGWTRLTGLASTAFTGTAPTTTTAGWTRVATGYGITNAHPKLNVFGTTCKYWIVTPTVDLGTGGNYTLTFDLAHTAYGSAAVASDTRADDKFMVIISTDNGATWQQTNTTIWDNVGSTRVFNNIPNVAQNVSIDLSSYSGQIKIAFYGESTATNGDNDIHIGNVVVTTCPAPNGLLANNITTSSADLTWNSTNASNYTLEYKMSSQSDWSLATSIPNLSTNTYPLQGLNHSTSYDFRVKANCVVGVDESVWNTSSFNTSCATITQFPWVESFENAFNTIAVAPGNKPSPFCWYIIDSINTSSYFWKTSSSAYNGSKSIYFEGYGSATTTTSTYNNNDWLISPVITLTGNERLNFWSKKSSSSYKPDLLIYAMDVSQGDLNPTASNANFIYLGEVDTNLLSTTYAPYEFNLSTLVGDYRFAFVRKKNANGSVYLDDVKVSAIPTCFPPTEVAISNISTDQADLNFTPASSGDPSWYMMLKDLTTNITDTTQIFTFPHTLLNLTSNTNYSVSIMTDCGDGSFSDVTNSVTFRTNCIPVTVPYFENFSSSVVTEPTCWTRKDGLLSDTSTLISSTSGWSHSNTLDTAMRFNIDATTDKHWLITPPIDLGDGSIQYQVEFDAVLTAYASAPSNPPTYDSDDKFAVVVSADNGLTWLKTNATIWAEGDIDTERNFSNFGLTPTHIVVKLIDSLQVPYSGIVKIGFYGESTVSVSDNYLYIDNVAINEIPNCPTVFNTTATVDNFSTIRVNFATDNAEPGIGWDIAYAETDPTSFDPNAATIVSVNDATELPYIITGLNAGSTYSLSVRQNCGGEWSPAVSSSIPNIESTVAVPYIQNFEDLNNVSEWTLSNPDTNKWYISNAVSYPDNSGNSLFISDSLGATNEYTNNVISYAYASTIVDFGTGAAEYNLSFDWRARGESSSYDYIKVFLLPIDQAIPTTGWPVGQALGTFNQQSTWQHANIILPASEYENTVKKLVFIWWNDGSTGTNPPAAVDNIQIVPMTCATPSNLVVSLVDQTSATISWTENGTSTSWLIEYSFNGINWTSELASTNTDFVLSNLNPSSTYQVRVYSLCSSIDTSSFVSNVFQTECGVISQFPWNEGFDEAFVGTSASNSLSASPRCWSNFNGGYTSTTYQWKRGTTASNIYAGAGYAYMDGYYSTSSATYTNNDWLITPVLQLTGNERLNFWIKKEGETYFPDLAIYVLDMNNGDVNATDSISNFTLLANIPNNTISTTYQQQEVDLSSLNGQYRLAFVRLQPSQYDLYIDEVKVSSLPNCRRVSDVALSNVSHEEATITWTPGQTTDAAWNIYLTQGSSTITIPVTQIPTTITNLLPNTDYSFVVKTDCGTEESDPTIPISFTTSCTPISVPFLEEFNTSPLTNDCWKQHNGLLADTVVFTSNTSPWAYNNSYPAASPITSMRLNIWNTTTNSWLVTPTIDLGNTSTLYQLEFDVTNSNLAMLVPGVLTGVDDKFAVVISTDNGLTWTSANAHIWSNETGATRVYNDLMSTTPIHIIIPLQDENLIPYQGLIKVGFYGESTVSNADNYLNIDNVAINEWADCQRPTGLAVNGVSFDQATISFTEQGTATSWEYSLGEVVTGVDNDPNAGTIVSIFDNPHTIQGLTPSTDYYIAVRSDCMSPWSDIVTFRTAALNVTTFPYTATFDEFDPESYNWTSLSNSVNRWVVGNATSSNLGTSTDLSSAYISFNDGDSNSATTATTRAYFYRDFDFGSTPTTYDLSFDWKCLGTYTSSTNTVSSGIMVIPCETTDSINLGGLPLNQNQRVLMLHSQTDWQNATAQLDNMSGVKRLIFYTWGYSSSNRYNPAAIDNITIEQSTCARPNGLVAANL